MSRVVLCFTTLCILACNQPTRLPDSPPVDPRRSEPQVTLAPIELDASLLITHDDFDKWEDQVIGRTGAWLAAMLYKMAFFRERRNPRMIARWAVLSCRDDVSQEFRFPFELVMNRLPSSQLGRIPDIRYAIGYMAWDQLTTNQGKLLGALDNPVLVDTVVTSWGEIPLIDPNWTGPHGVTVADLQAKLEQLQSSLENRQGSVPTLETSDVTLHEAVHGFYRTYEDEGSDKACPAIERLVRQQVEPASLGDALAHCALDRGRPERAIEQVQRMAQARVVGGIQTVLDRLRLKAGQSARLRSKLDALLPVLQETAAAHPQWATRCGLTPPPDRSGARAP